MKEAMDLNAPRFVLNDDTIMEILLFLPAKSLTRFRSVCKEWLSLISSDQFRLLHVLRHPKPQPSLILQAQTAHHFYLNPVLSSPKLIPYNFTIPYSEILNSCKGLLLLKYGNPVEYCMYNPTTKQSRKIGLAESDEFPDVMGLTLAFNPLKSPHYKIVCVRAKTKLLSFLERSCRVEVYDSQTRTWRLRESSAPTSANFSSGVHCNNVIYWTNSLEDYFLYYDINENSIGKTPRSQVPRYWLGLRTALFQLQESNGHLYHFITATEYGISLLDEHVAVYELKEDRSEWIFKHLVDFGQLPRERCRLSFMKGDEGGSSTLLTHVPGKIESYSFLEKRFKELVDLRNQPFYSHGSLEFDCRDVFEFGETLAPV